MFVGTLERALWTFVEAFLAVLVVTDVTTLASAGAAGLAAALVVVKDFARDRVKQLKQGDG